MKVKVLDGAVFTAPDAAGLIDAIHADEQEPRTLRQDWMDGYARRTTMLVQTPIRTDTDEHFIADLIDAKVMEILDES